MKILWHSNAPWTGSGYGVQTDLFTRLLVEAGHEVAVSATFGIRGRITNVGGVVILPQGLDAWGNDVLPAHVAAHKPDATVALLDSWVIDDAVLDAVPLCAWAPVDHDPMPPAVEQKLKRAAYPWAMTRFAEREMRRIGLDPVYVPHGVDTDVFRPMDRSAARQKLGVAADAFLAVCVAANKGFPSRKSLPQLLKAWARFTLGPDAPAGGRDAALPRGGTKVARVPEALLIVHTLPDDVHGGPDLVEVAKFYGVGDSVRFPDRYRMVMGHYGPDHLAVLYNAADVLALPSMGGGFEIPLVEAQACGCPVVTTGVTAMQELAGPGYAIPVDHFDGMTYTAQDSEQANVTASQILAGLEWAWEHRGDAKLRADSRAFAMVYDARRVFERCMLPALEKAAERNADLRAQGDALAVERDARTEARRALRNGNLAHAPFPQQEAI